MDNYVFACGDPTLQLQTHPQSLKELILASGVQQHDGKIPAQQAKRLIQGMTPTLGTSTPALTAGVRSRIMKPFSGLEGKTDRPGGQARVRLS